MMASLKSQLMYLIVLGLSMENIIVVFCHFTQIKLQLEMKTIKVCHFLLLQIEIQ